MTNTVGSRRAIKAPGRPLAQALERGGTVAVERVPRARSNLCVGYADHVLISRFTDRLRSPGIPQDSKGKLCDRAFVAKTMRPPAMIAVHGHDDVAKSRWRQDAADVDRGIDGPVVAALFVDFPGARRDRQAPRRLWLATGRQDVLILAEGTINQSLSHDQQPAAQAWLGPMVDAGFLQGGYVDVAGGRMWLVLAAEDRQQAETWLADLPIVRDRSVSFEMTQVTALRFA